MVIEADMAGNYVGSSYGWATTRIGQNLVVLAQRKWNGEQILEESWVKMWQPHRNVRGWLWGAVLVKRRW
jgi:hypothetical protein